MDDDMNYKQQLEVDYDNKLRHKRVLRPMDRDHFDPVDYLSVNTIVCKKYNYAVPASYGNSDLIIRYNKQKDTIDLFNVEHLMNKTKNDDGTVMKIGNRKLYKLDKLNYSIKIEDINGFIFGPFSTRFWMMRMGLNQLIYDNSKKA